MKQITDKLYRGIIVFLIVVVVGGGVVLALERRDVQPVEIALSSSTLPGGNGEVYVEGAVQYPGAYLLKEEDTLQSILMIAGVEQDADIDHIGVYVPRQGERERPQKVDINRAETWLLTALPGVGDVLAERIVDYRREHGSFKRVEDLCMVKGISEATLEKIKEYIAVLDESTF